MVIRQSIHQKIPKKKKSARVLDRIVSTVADEIVSIKLVNAKPYLD